MQIKIQLKYFPVNCDEIKKKHIITKFTEKQLYTEDLALNKIFQRERKDIFSFVTALGQSVHEY